MLAAASIACSARRVIVPDIVITPRSKARGPYDNEKA
jgi:hypothetical protein